MGREVRLLRLGSKSRQLQPGTAPTRALGSMLQHRRCHTRRRCPVQPPSLQPAHRRTLQGPKLYILTLGVLAPYRGLGAGSALLTRCLAHVAQQLPEVEEAVLHVQVRRWLRRNPAGWLPPSLIQHCHAAERSLSSSAGCVQHRCPGLCSHVSDINQHSALHQHQPPVVLLMFQTSNAEAIRFYQRFGFEVGETIPGYYKRLDPPDAVLLRKRLQPGGAAVANGEAA